MNKGLSLPLVLRRCLGPRIAIEGVIVQILAVEVFAVCEAVPNGPNIDVRLVIKSTPALDLFLLAVVRLHYVVARTTSNPSIDLRSRDYVVVAMVAADIVGAYLDLVTPAVTLGRRSFCIVEA